MTLKCGAVVTVSARYIEIWRRWGTHEAQYRRNASFASLGRLNRVLNSNQFDVEINHYTMVFIHYGGSRSPIHERQIRIDECTGPNIERFFEGTKT